MQEHRPTGLIDRIALAVARVMMWISTLIVAVIFYEVIARYIFLRPTLWAYELSWWSAGILYLFSGWYVLQQRAHIRLTLFYDLMPPPMRRAADALSFLTVLLFCSAVVWGGFNEAKTALLRWEGYGSAWNPPIPAIVKPLILVLVTMLAAQAASNLYFDWRHGDDKPDDNDESDGNQPAGEPEVGAQPAPPVK